MRQVLSREAGAGTHPGRRAAAVAALIGALLPALLQAQAAGTRRPGDPTAPTTAPTPASAAPLPSARTVIDRHIEAIGGRKAILGHTSTHATGTMSMASSGVSGSVEVFAARPDKSLVKLSIGGIGEVLEGFDGSIAWSVSAITGPMVASGKELQQKKFDAAYDADLHETARYRSMRTLEKTVYEGRPCYKVSLIHHDGTEDIEYYDVETRLRTATVATRESPMGAIKVTLSFADYRRFADLLVPTTMTQSTMGVQQVLRFSSVEFDKVPLSVFEPPAQIRAMVK